MDAPLAIKSLGLFALISHPQIKESASVILDVPDAVNLLCAFACWDAGVFALGVALPMFPLLPVVGISQLVSTATAPATSDPKVPRRVSSCRGALADLLHRGVVFLTPQTILSQLYEICPHSQGVDGLDPTQLNKGYGFTTGSGHVRLTVESSMFEQEGR